MLKIFENIFIVMEIIMQEWRQKDFKLSWTQEKRVKIKNTKRLIGPLGRSSVCSDCGLNCNLLYSS